MRIRSVSSTRVVGWPAWTAALVMMALLCAVIAYWAVTLLAPRAPIAPPALTLDPRALPELQQARLLFGVDQAIQAPARLANVEVVGIVAAGARGSAILVIDDKPPATFAVGEQLNTRQRLVEVRADAVVIGSASQRFEVPAPEGGSLAVLTGGSAQSGRSGASAPAGRTPRQAATLPRSALPPPGQNATLPTVPAPGKDVIPAPRGIPTTRSGAAVPPPAQADGTSVAGSAAARRLRRQRAETGAAD